MGCLGRCFLVCLSVCRTLGNVHLSRQTLRRVVKHIINNVFRILKTKFIRKVLHVQIINICVKFRFFFHFLFFNFFLVFFSNNLSKNLQYIQFSQFPGKRFSTFRFILGPNIVLRIIERGGGAQIRITPPSFILFCE